MNEAGFIEYELHTTDAAPALSEGKLMRYILASNGVFVYSRNNYFEALVPIYKERHQRSIGGLKPIILPFLRMKHKVPINLLIRVLSMAKKALPNEVLIYLDYETIPNALTFGWWCWVPRQVTSKASCTPDASVSYVPIEIHSHNTMDAFFSDTDDKDETGLRIYGVLGHVDRARPSFLLRISIFGHYWEIPYGWVFGD